MRHELRRKIGKNMRFMSMSFQVVTRIGEAAREKRELQEVRRMIVKAQEIERDLQARHVQLTKTYYKEAAQ